MSTNEPDVSSKLLEELDAQFAAGEISAAEHETRRARLLGEIQRGKFTPPKQGSVLTSTIIGLLLVLAGFGLMIGGAPAIGNILMVLVGAVFLVVAIAQGRKRARTAL
ncbi:SHOCT domain-containing protein [Propionibacterium freudenreichii]|uniref:SHOCT domain-containing protein n=1 Tax=Propionibacterium freudenreichii TaxID=1744 RepID=UPI002434385A|nr:SHOCT domain-containing protein [Propionibacterium freudenreichii]WFF32436.1 SHOCT domain-containing protein [Propionibacterium freudenreichii]